MTTTIPKSVEQLVKRLWRCRGQRSGVYLLTEAYSDIVRFIGPGRGKLSRRACATLCTLREAERRGLIQRRGIVGTGREYELSRPGQALGKYLLDQESKRRERLQTRPLPRHVKGKASHAS